MVDHTGGSHGKTWDGPGRQQGNQADDPQQPRRGDVRDWGAIEPGQELKDSRWARPDSDYVTAAGGFVLRRAASAVVAQIVADRANGPYKNPADPLSHREYQKLARVLTAQLMGDNDPAAVPPPDSEASAAALSTTFRELYSQAVVAPETGAAAGSDSSGAPAHIDFAKLGALLRAHNLEAHPAASSLVADLKAGRPDYRDLSQVPLTAAELRRLLTEAGPRAVLPYLRPPRIASTAEQIPAPATQSPAAETLPPAREITAADLPAEITDNGGKLYGDIVREHVDAIKQQRQHPPLNRPELAQLAQALAGRIAAGETLCPAVGSAGDGEHYGDTAVRDRGVMAVFHQSPPGLEAAVFRTIETTIVGCLFPHGDRNQPPRELTGAQLRIIGKLLRQYGIEYSGRPAVSEAVHDIVAGRAAAQHLTRGEAGSLAWSLVHKVQFGGGLETAPVPDGNMPGVQRKITAMLGDPAYANLTEGGLTTRGYQVLAKYLRDNAIEETTHPDVLAMIAAIKDARPDIGDLPLTPLEERLLAGQLMQFSIDEMRRNGGFDLTRLQLPEVIRHLLEGGAVEVETTNLYIADSIPGDAVPIITEGADGPVYETECLSGVTSDGRVIEHTAVMTLDNMTEADKVGFSLARAFVTALPGARFTALADDRMEVSEQKAAGHEQDSDGRSVQMVGVSDRLSQRYLESIIEVAKQMGIVSPGARNREECVVISEKEKLSAAADLERALGEQTQDPPPHARQKPIVVPPDLAAKGWAIPETSSGSRTRLLRTSGRETQFHNYYAENPLHQKFVTSDHNGPRCVTLDASTYLSTEGMFVVLLPLAKDDGMTRRNGGMPIMWQADQVWELLRSVGFPPDRVMVALYDPSVGAEKLAMRLREIITAEVAKLGVATLPEAVLAGESGVVKQRNQAAPARGKFPDKPPIRRLVTV